MVHPSAVLKEISFSAPREETDMIVRSRTKVAAFNQELFLIPSSSSVPAKQPRSLIKLLLHPMHNTRYQVLIKLEKLISDRPPLIDYQLTASFFCEFVHFSHGLGNRPVTSTCNIEYW